MLFEIRNKTGKLPVFCNSIPMKTKLLFIIALLQFPLLGFSQKTEPIKCSVNFSLLKNDSVYIKGTRGKKAISKKFFKSGMINNIHLFHLFSLIINS